VIDGDLVYIMDTCEVESISSYFLSLLKKDPDWVPGLRIAAGVITNRGGRTCHAAIVSRELGVPCIVGTKDATEKLETGDIYTIDCSNGSTGLV
jgi:pyruvate,water dikinase